MTPHARESCHLDTIDVARPTGAPVLCLHGMFAGSWAFEQLMPLIAERGHPVSALSFRGHPPNPTLATIGSQSLMDFEHDAEAAARALHRPIVIGHSMGGLVALMLAQRNLVRAAVLISPAPPRGIPIFSARLLLRMGRYLPALLRSKPFIPIDDDFDTLVLNRLPVSDRAAVRARMVPDSGRAAREIALGAFAVPSRIPVPMLITGSEHDRFIPARIARRMAARYGSELYIAMNHGHFLFGEPGWRDEAAVALNWIRDLPAEVRTPGPHLHGAAPLPQDA